jgi:sporulation protein YlmC with PRC-barrel domain
MRGPLVMSASTLIGERVVNSEGENLGKIEEIVIDVAQGRIGYAVLSFGAIPGFGGQLFAIPWDALGVDTDENVLILDIDPDVLRTAPGFDRHHWPDMTNAAWASKIHHFYGYRPYWED